MAKEQYCYLCSCSSHRDMPGDLDQNWDCPIVGKKICLVDCKYEVEGAMGAPDTLRRLRAMTGKTAIEIRAICISCPYGGKKLERPPRIVSIINKEGLEVTKGIEILERRKEVLREWNAKLECLNDPNYPPASKR